VQDTFSIYDAGEGSRAENLPSVEDDWGVEDDSHGVVMNQRRTPYLMCQLSVLMTSLRTMGFTT
jgi:hypothetical protein